MSPRTRTPVNCVWASAFVAALLGLLAFAGGAASSAIFSLAIMGQYVAYSIPISSRFLGAILAFPTTPAPMGPNMDYMIAVMGGWIILCLIYFYFPKYGGVYWFDGPRANLEAAGNGTEPKDTETTSSSEKSPI
ncbi:hypothetical protein OBBRIDRAFT_795157 [Obba rivulosa]|uniref:Uncharacterized protein n=1 Tax=Obba rivulosa TaxID=1052685 RepID=A0A8E2APJ5_9APHY|nr:hypothetical protein OBBRIDRAFT_795157 [Obba rivulosa]